MADSVPVTFERPCRTAVEFAERYRVLAALSSEGVRFTMTPDELRAMAGFFDAVGERPGVLVVEREVVFSDAMALWLAFCLSLSAFGLLGGAAAALLRWFGVVL
jgi:hypothetical protein